DDVVGERGEVALPRVAVRAATDERWLVEDDERVLVGHELRQPAEVAAVDAVDEADRSGDRWQWAAGHRIILRRTEGGRNTRGRGGSAAAGCSTVAPRARRGRGGRGDP